MSLSASFEEATRIFQIDALSKMVDPEAFGLPDIIEPGTITDRDAARDKARAIMRWIEGGMVTECDPYLISFIIGQENDS